MSKDICMWKYKGETWEYGKVFYPSCKEEMECTSGVMDFSYCPYCGKRLFIEGKKNE